MKEYVIDSSGHKIRYHDLPGTALPIIFIHGLGCAGSYDYPEVAAQPVLSAHRRILVDLLGSGFSDKPNPYDYSVQGHVHYLMAFIKALQIDKFILFGHSLGGAIAIELATQCQDQIKALILSEANLDKSTVGCTSYTFGSCDEQDFIISQFQKEVDTAALHNSMWGASLSVCSPLAMYRISLSAIKGGTPSWREQLYALSCPTTFIFGEKSLPDPDEMILHEQGIHIEIVRDAGHSMSWENPYGLAQAIANGISTT